MSIVVRKKIYFFSKYVSNSYLQTMHRGGLEEENALGQKIGLKK